MCRIVGISSSAGKVEKKFMCQAQDMCRIVGISSSVGNVEDNFFCQLENEYRIGGGNVYTNCTTPIQHY